MFVSGGGYAHVVRVANFTNKQKCHHDFMLMQVELLLSMVGV
jgi:hypothetical protein